MPTPNFVCGAECGVNAIGTAQPAGSLRHWSTFGASVSVQTGGGKTSGDHSLRSYKFNPAAATTDTLAHLFSGAIASPSTLVVRFKLLFDVLPNAIHTIVSNQAGNNGIRYNPTGTKLEAFAGNATTTVAGGFVPVVGTVYLVDVKMVRDTTATTDWRIDEVAQTQASKGSQTAATTTGFTLGHNGTGANGSVATTATYYIDDIITSGASADYPFGPGRIVGLYPVADSSQGPDIAAGHFKYENSTNVAVGATDTWSHLQNPLSTTVGNFISVNTTTGTSYLQWLFSQLGGPCRAVNGVCFVSAHHSAGTGANTQDWSVLDNAGNGPIGIVVGYDYSDTSISFNSVIRSINLGGGAWSEIGTAGINEVRARYTGTADIVAVPFIDGICMEVDHVLDLLPNQPRRNNYHQLLAH